MEKFITAKRKINIINLFRVKDKNSSQNDPSYSFCESFSPALPPFKRRSNKFKNIVQNLNKIELDEENGDDKK